MMNLVWFLVALIIVLFVVSFLWSAFGVGELVATMSRTQRLLLALLGLVLIIGLLLWFFNRYMPLGLLS